MSAKYLIIATVLIWNTVEGAGGGGGGGAGKGKMAGNGNRNQDDQRQYSTLIDNLLDNHEFIERNSTVTDDGIEAITTSNDPTVAGWIKTHVQQMKALMDSEDGIIREWDELFEAAFELRDFHNMTYEIIDDGVRVVQYVVQDVEGDERDCARAIIRAHAGVVDKFTQSGRDEAQKNHDVPGECDDIIGSFSSGANVLWTHHSIHVVFISWLLTKLIVN